VAVRAVATITVATCFAVTAAVEMLKQAVYWILAASIGWITQ